MLSIAYKSWSFLIALIGICIVIRKKRKINKIFDTSNLTDALNTKVVIPFEDESQSKTEGYGGYASDNYMLLQKELGSLTKKIVMPWSSVEKGHLLGEGAYGQVYHGFLNVGEFARVEIGNAQLKFC